MSKLDLSRDMNIEVTARLIEKGSDKPLQGAAYKVRLYDRDFFEDDFLGESGLNHEGRALIVFNPAGVNRNAVVHEDSLDFYFTVFQHDKMIFRSPVMRDIVSMEEFRMGEGEQIDLGTFLVDTGR
jgi:hypothetical protein